MSLVTPRGNINCPIWAITYEPSEADKGAGTVMSGSVSYHWDKMVTELGLPRDIYVTSLTCNALFPGNDENTLVQGLVNLIHQHHPVILLLIGSRINEILCPETRNYKKPHDCKLDKWAGSLLISPLLSNPHYCIPLWPVDYIFMDWAYRDIYKCIDLGKAHDEYVYWTTNSVLNPLPSYSILTGPTFSELVDFLNYCRASEYNSSDIETIRPSKNSKFYKGHPGYFYTIALAPNSRTACSFCIWDYPREQLGRIWEELNYVLKHVPQIGQNYIQFDAHHEEALGFEPCINRCQDTRIRHHILWPELPHSLQFQTKQYTRQKYYKDEGKTWKPSQKKQLMNYNALDVLVTYEIYEKQEEEFTERPHLR